LALAEKTKNQKKEQGGVRNKLTDDAPGTPLPGLQPERRPARSAEDAAGVWIPVTMAAGINRAHIRAANGDCLVTTPLAAWVGVDKREALAQLQLGATGARAGQRSDPLPDAQTACQERKRCCALLSGR